jgi:hypothetical protein
MNTVKTPTQYGIIHLSDEEKKEPASVILELFSMSSLHDWRMDLWQYLKAATTKLGWFMLSQPGDAVFLQKMLERLMECCWLLLQEREEQDGEEALPAFAPFSAECQAEERQKRLEYDVIEQVYVGKIRLLRQRELDNPFLVLKAFFETMPLAEWKNMLSDWTEYALRRTSLFEETENYDLLVHYEQLEKLLEAAYILSIQVQEKGMMPNQQGDES